MSMRYAAVSYWLETAGDLAPRPALDSDREFDVVIVGAGLTGLWTAWYLLDRDPGLRVAVCEAEIAGFGASGRNGSWCSAGIGLTAGALRDRFGVETAREVVATMRDTVDEVGRVCAAEDIDAQFHKAGTLRIALGAHEVAAVHRSLDAHRALGTDSGFAVLSADELTQRVRICGARGALYDPHCATIHPGRLVRGLADAIERRGAVLYERTRVTRIAPRDGGWAAVQTGSGRLRARAVVTGTEAWTVDLPGRRRSLLPVYSLIVLTEPLDERQWRRIGWSGRETLSSHRLSVDYLARTADGRVLLGGRGAPYHFRSQVAAAHDRHPATHATLRAMLPAWFPALDGVAITHEWGGPLGMPRDFVPNFRFDPSTGLGAAYGYTGQGVGASNLAGRTMADLVADRDSALTRLPMAGHRSRRWEPEPLRWIGARYVQTALRRTDERAVRTGRPPSGRSLAERLMRH